MKIKNRVVSLFFWLFCLAFLFSCSPELPVRPANTPVQPADSGSGIVVGVLPNGFQYLLKKNQTPANEVAIHLNIFAGSMHETDQEQGIAHFLEHMLFNGSEHFPPGELAKYFPTIGMDYGADANARTSFFNTVYDLFLPDSSSGQIDKAFVIIQDYAGGALLLEDEIQREKGVILAEKRERDSVSYRTFKKTLAFELPGSRMIRRFPIGVADVISGADRKLLKGFYDQWYRPENMALIVVGDMDIPMVEQMIRERFSKLSPRSRFIEREMDTRWTPHQGTTVFYHHEPEAGNTEVSIETLVWKPFKAQTPDDLKQMALYRITDWMLQNRLSRMVNRQTANFTQAGVFSGRILHHVTLAGISAACEPGEWETSLEQIEMVLRQGLKYGFSQAELARVKTDYIASLDRAVVQAPTRKTRSLARSILNRVNKKQMLLSPDQERNLLKPFVEAITIDDVHQTLKQQWAQNHRLVLVTGNAEIKSPGKPEEHILNVYRKSTRRKVETYEGLVPRTFPYLKPSELQAPLRSRKDDLNGQGITVLEFGNNVRVNLKKTDFKANQFIYKVSFGPGSISEPAGKTGLSHLAQTVMDTSGFANIDRDQLDNALAGKKVGMSFRILDNHFALSGAAAPDEATLVFDLIHHFFNDPGFRREALNLSKTRYRQNYEELSRTPEGAMAMEGFRFLAGGDAWFGMPTPEKMNAYSLEDIRTWILPYIESSPVEISITGDFDLEQMVAISKKFSGVFGQRKPFSRQETVKKQVYFPAGKALDLKVKSKIKTSEVHVAFPTDDFWDIRQTRRLMILSRILSERLQDLIREELGQSYSPYVYNSPSVVFDGYGTLQMVVKAAPEKTGFVYEQVVKMVSMLDSKPITEEEVQRALNPVISHIQQLRSTNRYWLNSVLVNSSRFPQKIQWAQEMLEDYQSVSRADMVSLVKKYLAVNKSARITILSD